MAKISAGGEPETGRQKVEKKLGTSPRWAQWYAQLVRQIREDFARH
jgi:hypothetical protein